VPAGCGSLNSRHRVIDLKLIQIFVVTQCQPYRLPQPVGTLAELSKYHLLVNENHIQVFFIHNTEARIVN